LLAAHNGGKWIVQQVETILSQTGVDVRLLVSDDGSSDDTRAKVAAFGSDPRISIVAPPTPTGSAAKNFIWLICNASADSSTFVAFADQDDIWLEDKLARAISALENQGSAGYSCAVTAFWDHGREKKLGQQAAPTALDFMFEGAGQGCTFVLQNVFFRRIQDFFRSHAFQLQALHYHDWAIYALSRSWRLSWYFDPRPMVRYRQHGQNDTGARHTGTGIGKRLRLIRNGWYRRQLVVTAAMCALAAPQDRQIAAWNELIAAAPTFMRRMRMARICMVEGRRRTVDNLILLAAVLGGWV
jgi:rhamnosyltransferase